MTIQDLKALSDRELDARLLKLLCPTPEGRCPKCGWPLEDSIDKGCVEGSCSQRPAPKNFPRFSQSLDAIAPLEAKTIEKVGIMQYASAVQDAVGRYILEMDLLTAPARHRAEAVLLCWEEE